MQNQQLRNDREVVNKNISKLSKLGSTKREVWKGKLRNRSI